MKEMCYLMKKMGLLMGQWVMVLMDGWVLVWINLCK